MMNSPCARLMIFIMPKMMARPEAQQEQRGYSVEDVEREYDVDRHSIEVFPAVQYCGPRDRRGPAELRD